MTRPGSSTITCGIIGLWDGSVYSAVSRSFLDAPSRVGEERPVGADAGAIFIRLDDIVGADRDEPAIGDLKLAMEFDKQFRLPAVLGAVTTTAEDEHHWMRSLQFGEFPAFRAVVGKLVVGKDSPWNDVRSHVKLLFLVRNMIGH